MDCYILSAVPGAGKTTWIKDQPWFHRSVTYSADHFFLKDGVYQFDPAKLSEAHGQCLRQFAEACQPKRYGNPERPVLVVDNTNTTAIEIAPYYSIAKAYGYEVTLVTLWCDPEVAFKRCIHGVSHDSISRMSARMMADKVPPFWDLKFQSYRWTAAGWRPSVLNPIE